MTRLKKGTPPKYRFHKPRDAAKVTIDRQDIYLGKHESPESYANYAMALGMLRAGRTADDIRAAIKGGEPATVTTEPPASTSTLTVGQLAVRYWTEYASEYFKSSTGLSRGRTANAKLAIRAVNDIYASLPVDQFTTLCFREVRQALVARKLSRKYINDLMALVIDLFRWGVEHCMVPVNVPRELREVKRLRSGKSDAKETEATKPVALADIDATLEHMAPTLRDMVRVQLWSGARPNEICLMRVDEITFRPDGTWCYRPSAHKSSHRGKERRLFLGPKSQEILRPYLAAKKGGFVFTHTWKGTPKRYERESYTQAIVRACERANVKPWTANQLRHARATEVRSQYDLETAAAVLGHASPDITLIYAETNFEKAAAVASRIG